MSSWLFYGLIFSVVFLVMKWLLNSFSTSFLATSVLTITLIPVLGKIQKQVEEWLSDAGNLFNNTFGLIRNLPELPGKLWSRIKGFFTD